MIGTIMDVDRRKRIEEERLELTKKLEKMASIDKLTGILNRQRFESLLQEKMDQKRLPLCLIMFDLDRFKDLNDARGHLEGDRALVLASEAVSGRLRMGDLFGRWGGDEFMVALEQDLDKSLIVAEDLRKRICDALGESFQGVTASFGLALWNGKASLENLSNMADEALYRAKKDGRNRVVVFDDAGYN
jgi:diguanylate cyclase (GGDEF)-like protein